MNTLLPTTLDAVIRWLMDQTRQTPPPAWTTEAGTWRVYPAHEVARGPQEPWRVVIPAVPPDVAPHYGQFHLPPGPALEYAALVFYLLPHGEEQVEVHGVCLQPALAPYYRNLWAQLETRWLAPAAAATDPPAPLPAARHRPRRRVADAAALRLAVTGVLRAYWFTTGEAGVPPTLAAVAACLRADERTLARWLTRADLRWERLVLETEWGGRGEPVP